MCPFCNQSLDTPGHEILSCAQAAQVKALHGVSPQPGERPSQVWMDFSISCPFLAYHGSGPGVSCVVCKGQGHILRDELAKLYDSYALWANDRLNLASVEETHPSDLHRTRATPIVGVQIPTRQKFSAWPAESALRLSGILNEDARCAHAVNFVPNGEWVYLLSRLSVSKNIHQLGTLTVEQLLRYFDSRASRDTAFTLTRVPKRPFPCLTNSRISDIQTYIKTHGETGAFWEQWVPVRLNPFIPQRSRPLDE